MVKLHTDGNDFFALLLSECSSNIVRSRSSSSSSAVLATSTALTTLGAVVSKVSHDMPSLQHTHTHRCFRLGWTRQCAPQHV